MGNKTPTQIQNFLDESLYRFDQPVQYFGDEPNTYRKPWDSATLRFCIFANWSYEATAGNQAIPMVYKLVNEFKDSFLADRWYFPSTVRDLKILEAADIPCFGIESKHQFRDFDVIGSSISYPMLALNFAKQLSMADIPPTWADRTDSQGNVHPGRRRNPEAYPFVLVGGQSYGAPEMTGTIADAVFCGEAEDEEGNPGLGAVLARVEAFKEQGLWNTDRMECYKDLAREFRFLYFQCFVDVHYAYEERPSVSMVAEAYGHEEVHPSKQIVGYSANIEGMALPIVKRFVKDLDSIAPLSNPPLLYFDPGMGSGDLEAARGCTAWCSFCALTYRQKPFRQRSVEKLVDFGAELVKNMGGIHLSPFAPDFPVYTEKKRLIKELVENVTDHVDQSSMRVDDAIADNDYFLIQTYAGMDTVTLGVEGNSQRMRDLVGKGASDEDVKEALVRGIHAGIRKFKFYMISSLPGEDRGDVLRILRMGEELAALRDSMGSKAQIIFSWTPMLIEGNTPFQWFAPTPPNMDLSKTWEGLKEMRIQYKLGGKAGKDKLGIVQTSHRASREIAMAIIEAVCEVNVGVWGGAPRGIYEMIEANLIRHGFLNGFADVLDERQKHDLFGWEFIDQGINSELLWVTYQQMVEFLESTDSETYDAEFSGADYHGSEWVEKCDTKCMGKTCGVCDMDDLRIRREYIVGASREIDVSLETVTPIDQSSVVQRVRAKIHRSHAKRQVQNDHWRYAVRRAAYRAGVPISKRTIKFTTDANKFKEWTSGVDYVEFGLTRRVTNTELAAWVQQMNVELQGALDEPPLAFGEYRLLSGEADTLKADVDLSLFEMELDKTAHEIGLAITAWEKAEYVPMTIRTDSQMSGITSEEVNGKDLVGDFWVVQRGASTILRMTLRGRATPYIAYASLFGKRSWMAAAKYPADRVEAFVAQDDEAVDFFRLSCEECLRGIPTNPLDQPFHSKFCPKCLDAQTVSV